MAKKPDIHSVFGKKADGAQTTEVVASSNPSTQTEVTQKQRNTHFAMTQNQLADKKWNPVSDRKGANVKVKTKKGTGNPAQGGAN